jgi:hypothetical protein
MSFSTLLPYFRARLSVRHPELNEWADAFNVDNIPATKLGKAYHVELLPANYVGTAHVILAFRAQVRVRVFVKGYAKPEQAVDKATSYADSIIKECCKSTNRLTQPAIKNVLPISVDVKALALTNDNAAYLDLTFECNLMLNPDAP